MANTELDVQEAMTRRALAFDLAGLIDYHIFQEWTSRLFQLMRQPAPPGFKQPTLVQLLRTDRQGFVRMQELARDGIKPRPDGTRPVDGILENMRNDSSVMSYMLPAQHVHRERSRGPGINQTNGMQTRTGRVGRRNKAKGTRASSGIQVSSCLH